MKTKHPQLLQITQPTDVREASEGCKGVQTDVAAVRICVICKIYGTQFVEGKL